MFHSVLKSEVQRLLVRGSPFTTNIRTMAVVTPNICNDKTIFPDFQNGPLTHYRHKAKFCYKKLRVHIEGEEFLQFQYKVWNFMKTHPDFQRDQQSLSLDEERKLANRRQMIMWNEQLYSIQDFMVKPKLALAFSQALYAYDPSFGVKYGLCFGMFPSVIQSLGTDRLLNYIDQNIKAKVLGSFSLTEVAHGTNARGMRTTATYDLNTNEFILNTPDFEAAKCWVGNLGKTCTHSIVYAQLYAADGKNYGLNAFLVPIRDINTLTPHPGVTVGDLGEKIGLNGIDNGFVMFTNYRIPKENLLSKTGDIDSKGNFTSPIRDNRKRLGASLGALSAGRVNICGLATIMLIKATTVAIRYSAARRQFGPENSTEELPVLEYQSQQFRLLPHLANAFAMRIFSLWLSNLAIDMQIQMLCGEDVSSLGMEIHALSSAAKPICAWAARDGIQECREACGGHGYLKAARIGDIRNDNDANCTYEGENNVLTQQASNWLIGLRRNDNNSDLKNVSPLNSVTFLNDFDRIKSEKCTFLTIKEAMQPENLLLALNWLCVHQLDVTMSRCDLLQSEGKTAFEIRNNTQAFHASTLSAIYAVRTIFYVFMENVNSLSECEEKEILKKLLSFYGANIIVKYLSIFYQGGFFTNQKQSYLYQDGILNLLDVLKDQSISLIDAIAPPDFMVNSVLGTSDGNVYQHLQSAILHSHGALERPNWWKEVIFKEYLNPKL